jgi:serine/threonine protein phosphatase PrpC
MRSMGRTPRCPTDSTRWLVSPKCHNQGDERRSSDARADMTVGRWGAITDTGRLRAVNEDAMLAKPPIFLIADGMGGHLAGDVASWLAVDRFVDLVGQEPITLQQVTDTLASANQAILDAADSDPQRSGMGTTVSGIASVVTAGADHWMVFNIGDSRVYRLAQGRLEQLTVDHSEAEEMVVAGRITREEARSYHRRNVVTRSLGTDPAPVADSWMFPPIEGERFMVCSDGLTTEVDDEAIRGCLVSNADPQRAAEALVDMAVAAGGRDNVTVIVVDGAISTEAPPSIDVDTTPRPD